MSISASLVKEAFTVGHAISAAIGVFGHAVYTKVKALEAKVVAAAKVVEADVKKVL